MHKDNRLPMKIVGRKGEPKVNVVTFDPMQKMLRAVRRGQLFIPKGVWRFKTYEEADKWTMDMLTRPQKRARQA
jgi:hypothetical protein